MRALESEVEVACSEHDLARESTKQDVCRIRADVKKYLYRRPMRLPVSCCSAVHTRRSRRCEHRERREYRRHQHPARRRVGWGRVIKYASHMASHHETRVHGTKRYHLKATFGTKVPRKIGSGGKVLLAPLQEGLTIPPSAVDIVSIIPRGLPQSAETTATCHNTHLTQDPQVETTNRASYHQQPASAAVRRRRGVSRWSAARLMPRSPDSQVAHEVCLNHRRSLCKMAKHA